MKRILKRAFAALLVTVMLLCAAPLTGIADFVTTASAAEYKVGDTIYFGSYPNEAVSNDYLRAKLAEQRYDAKGVLYYNGKRYIRINSGSGTSYYTFDPIEWRVLSVDSDGIYIMSNYVLDAQPYNSTFTSITWADCTLREWLNGYFYNLAFTDAEKQKINLTHLVNGDNPWYGTEGGIDTYDRVFIPSLADVLNSEYGFYPDPYWYDSAKQIKATDFSVAQGVSGYYHDNYYSGSYHYERCGGWWLRTPGDNSNVVSSISHLHWSYLRENYCEYSSIAVSITTIGVVPALKINPKSSIYQPQSNSNYSIKVVDDSTGQPVNGASVSFEGNTVKTKNGGVASFETSASSSSTAAVTVSASGYSTQTLRLYELNPYSMNTVNLSSESNPLSMALANVYLNSDEIKGPTVSILGKSFPLFKCSAGINIPLSDIVKVNVSTENDAKNKTAKYILGVNPNYSLDSDAERSEDYQNFKGFYKAAVGGSNQNALNKYNKLRKLLKDEDGSLGFSCGIKFAGYLEFSYATGKMVLKEGGIIITAEVAVSADYSFFEIGYATFKLGGELSGGLTLSQTSSGLLDASMEFGFGLKPSIGIGAKLLMKDLASVEAGIDGSINVKLKLPENSLKKALSAYLSAQCYVKAKALLLFERKWSTNFPNVELFPNPFEVQTSGSGGSIEIDENGNIVSIDEDDLELISRDYRNYLTTNSFSEGDLNDSSVYPYGYPQLVELDDGRTVAMFIYDDGTKSDINRTTLYFSVCSNGKWSTPKPVCNSGRADFPAEVCSDGEKIYAVWQCAAEVMQDSYSVDDVVDKTELVYAEYDGTSWTEPVTIDTADKYQMMYSIAENDGKIAVEWLENSENDYQLSSGVSTVSYKTFENGTWSSANVVAEETGITGACVGFVEDEVKVIYSMDSDGDLTTSGDSELYINGTQLTDNSDDENEISYQNGAFYWVKNGELYCYDGAMRSVGLTVENDYRVLKNGNSTAITYLETDGFKNEIMVSYLSGAEYSNPVALTKYGKHIGYYDAVMNQNGEICILADVDNLSEDKDAYPYTTTDMICSSFGSESDIGIYSLTYDGVPVRGGEISFVGTVKNNGTKTINSYDITFKNSAGQTLKTETIFEALRPGECRDFGIPYLLSDSFTKQTVTAEVVANEDSDQSNNKQSVVVGYADIEVVNADISESGVITATVVNSGLEAAKNVKATIYAVGDTDETLTTVEIGSLGIGETKDIKYTVAPEKLAFESAYVVKKFKIEATTDTPEESEGNNALNVIYAPTPTTGIALSSTSISLTSADKAQLTATVYPSDAYNKTVHWISDSVDVATVDANGNITPKGPGMAIITAITDDGGFIAQCEVTVTVPVQGISMKLGSVTMNVGEAQKLEYDLNPTNTTETEVSWKSSDTTVATVDNDGNVTACASGKTTITAEVGNGKYSSTCELTVINAVKGLTLSDNSLELYINSTRRLTANVNPSNADNTAVMWYSDNDEVASVDESGLVTAVGTGTTTITARTVDGGYTSSCTVKVGKHVSSLVLSEEELTLVQGLSTQITATVMPLKALNKTVTWVSLNPKVATVDSQGNVTAIQPGKAVIYAETEDGEISASCTVTVTNSASGYNFDSKAEYIQVGGKVQLSGEFSPTDAVNKNLSWATSDGSIASVSDSGLVSGKKAGSAVITVTTEDGGFKDYCIVRVVGITASTSLTTIDSINGYIYGVEPGSDSLATCVTLSDSSCTLEYDNKLENIGTGSIVNLVRSRNIVDSYTIVLFGDVNGDGWYDGQDAVMVSMLANGMLTREQVGEAVYMAADCNHDGVIDQADVDLLNQAGALLSSVDQTLSTKEMLETAAYKEYSELIDQTPTIDEAEDNTTEENPTEETPTANNLWTILTAYLEKILSFIISLFKIA